jgi:casein kinase 1
MGELAPPEGSSTQAQFQHSQPNLATANRAAPATSPNVQQPRQQQPEKPSVMQKIMNVLCCGAGK